MESAVSEAIHPAKLDAAINAVKRKLDVSYKDAKKIVEDFTTRNYLKALDNVERILDRNLEFTERDRNIVKLLQDSGASLVKGINDDIQKRIAFATQQSILNNEGIEPLVKRLREIQDISSHNLERIARTETIRTLAVSTINGYEQSGLVEKVSWLTAEDEYDVCQYCALKNGQVFEMQEAITQIPLHPNCFIDGQIPIYTSKGHKQIAKIKKGDLVLTHKGRFKPVTEIIRFPKYKGNIITLSLKLKTDKNKGAKNIIKLATTEDHPVLVNGKWTLIKNIEIGKSLSYLANVCKICGEKKYVFADIEVIGKKIWQPKRAKKLYNFSVAEDESYIAKNIVVHNCRCSWTPIVDFSKIG